MQDIVILERKLEDYIYGFLKGDFFSVGLEDLNHGSDMVFRQFNLGPYGIIDILTVNVDYDGTILFSIYELKKDEINKDTLIQVLKYKAGLLSYLQGEYRTDAKIGKITCYMIGGSVSQCNDFDLVSSASIDVYIYTYDIDISEGLILKCENFKEYNAKTPRQLKSLNHCLSYLTADHRCGYYHYEKKWQEDRNIVSEDYVKLMKEIHE